MELTREMRRKALAPFRGEWQYTSRDEWGVTLGHWFGVAEVLHTANVEIPERWGYRPPLIETEGRNVIANWHADDQPCVLASGRNYGTDDAPIYDCGCGEEHYYVPFLDAGEAGIEMLRYAGNVIDRYAGWLTRAGKDY